MNFEALKDNIITWAHERQILQHSNPRAQLLKTVEELGELASALNKNDRVAMIDGYGDVLVTLIVGARMANINIVGALESAWHEIKDRKGTLNANGVFVKEESAPGR